MIDKTENLSRDEAQQALDSINKIEASGWRRAVPDRFFGAVVAVLIGGLFAIYALPNPHEYIVFPILGLAVFAAVIATAREKNGAYGRDISENASGVLKPVLFVTALLAVFFTSIIIRRTYDLAWVPLLVGGTVALTIFLLSESERRAYLAKSNRGAEK